MKLRYVPLIFLLALLSCEKSTDLDYGLFANWKIASIGRSWEASGITVQTDGYFACNHDTSIQIFFSSLPVGLGKYHIVDVAKVSSHSLGSKDIAVEYNVGINEVYLSIDGTDSASIVVTDKGFYHAYIPTSKVVHYYNGSALDTTTASGDISFPDH